MTDRQMCLRLARALWPGPGLCIEFSPPGASAFKDWLAWVDNSRDFYASREVCDGGPDGRGRTKAAAIANLLTKLERLAEKREDRLGAALVAVAVAREARKP